MGDNQVINRIRVESSKTRNRGTFSGSLAALIEIDIFNIGMKIPGIFSWMTFDQEVYQSILRIVGVRT